MPIRPAFEVAARLARMYGEIFPGKKKRRPLRISHDNFYRVAELKALKAAKYREIASILLKEHDLVLGRAEDFFSLVDAEVCMDWAQISTSQISRELRRRPPVPDPAPAASTALPPAAAWPFPVKPRQK